MSGGLAYSKRSLVFADQRRKDTKSSNFDEDGGSGASFSDVEGPKPQGEWYGGQVAGLNCQSRYSIGETQHYAGTCKPCAFYYEPGCSSGAQCEFCHLCPPGEGQRRKRDRRRLFRGMKNSALRDSSLRGSGPRPGFVAPRSDVSYFSSGSDNSPRAESLAPSTVVETSDSESRITSLSLESIAGPDHSNWEAFSLAEDDHISGIRTPDHFESWSRDVSPERYSCVPQQHMPDMAVLQERLAMKGYVPNMFKTMNFGGAFSVMDNPSEASTVFPLRTAPHSSQCSGTYGQCVPSWSHVPGQEPRPMMYQNMGLRTSCTVRR